MPRSNSSSSNPYETAGFRNQQTLAKSVQVEGVGYWSGRTISLEFHPAEADTGIVFVRSDLPNRVRIPASVEHRVEVPRRTNLVHQGASVEMVEHVLAALVGAQVDNCEVVVSSAEMPGLDGSCQEVLEALLAAGIETQMMPRPILRVTEPCRVGDEEQWVEARPAKSGLNLCYRLDYDACPAIGRETLSIEFTPNRFRKEIAPARTFLLESEAQWLRSQGRGDHISYRDLLVFNDEGPIDNELRFENECVRHKILDMVGDLALAGCDLVGTFHAHRSGHRLNAALVAALLVEEKRRYPARYSA